MPSSCFTILSLAAISGIINGQLEDSYEEKFVLRKIPRELKWETKVDTSIYLATGEQAPVVRLTVIPSHPGEYNAYKLDRNVSKYIQIEWEGNNQSKDIDTFQPVELDWIIPRGPHSVIIIGEHRF